MKKLKKAINLMQTPSGRKEFFIRSVHHTWKLWFYLAFIYRRTLLKRVKIVAIVGSLGKTTTVRAIKTAVGFKNVDPAISNQYGALSFSILMTNPFASNKIIEVAIAHPGEMDKIGRAILPDIVVFNSVGRDHLQNFTGIEHIKTEKAQILKYVRKNGYVFANGDDQRIIESVKISGLNYSTYGFQDGNDIQCTSSICNLENGMNIIFKWKDEQYRLHARLFNQKLAYSLLAGFGVATKLGIDKNISLVNLSKMTPAPGRMELYKLKNGTSVIGDFYKATLDSLIPAFNLITNAKVKRKIIIMGGIAYLEDSSVENYLEHGRNIAKTFTHAIFIGDMEKAFTTGSINGGMKSENIFLSKKKWENSIAYLPTDLNENDLIYITGRQWQKLERILLRLSDKNVSCKSEWCDSYMACKSCSLSNVSKN